MTNIDTALVELPKDAIEQLRTHQRQLDPDGWMVGVSRQAIDEVLAWIDTRALQSTREKKLEEALEQLLDDMGEDGLCVCQQAKDEAIAALSNGEREGQSVPQGTGWVYFNEDTGTEYARNHPVESGECPDATDIRPATVMEDVLNNRVQELFHDIEAIKERQSFANPDGEREALPVQGGEEERARIVAWLRRIFPNEPLPRTAKYIADAIERGDHLPAQQPAVGEESGE